MKIKTGLIISILATLGMSASTFAQDVFDSDGDGIDDNRDNCTLTANVDQRDTDGDSFGNRCDADFNGDLQINFGDLAYISQSFQTNDEHADLNGDGNVNFGDVFIFSELFLAVPGPTATDPNQPPCTCYFSGDCPGGTFCNYGPGRCQTEDICVWRDIKPLGVVGAGCSIESDLTTGDWTPDICDGVCTAANRGSSIGFENTELVADAMHFWGEAMINPSAKGGGPVDEAMAQRALDLQFNGQDIPIILGRYAADALAMSAGEPFHDYFCHYEGHPEDPVQPTVNLANDPCRVTAGRLTIQALAAELKKPGSARAIMQDIPSACPNWQGMFTTQCESGPDALNCAIAYIESEAMFLRTPFQEAEKEVGILDQFLGAAGR